MRQDFTATINFTVEHAGSEPITKEDFEALMDNFDQEDGYAHVWSCLVEKVKGGQVIDG